MADEKVLVRLKAMNQQYNSAMRESAQESERWGSSVVQSADRVGQKMQKVGGIMTATITGPLLLLGKQAVDSASRLEQSVGGVESVFGDAAGTIFDFGETAADSAGLAKSEVNEMAAKIGASLKGMGFDSQEAADTVVELEKRAADMAATFGGTTAEAIDAIGSLMRGERDPIEKYGVSLKQVDINAKIAAMGLDTSTVAAEKTATATASLALLMEQTADTAGQFGREQDTAAGASARFSGNLENLKAELGQELLPAVASGTELLTGLVKRLGEMDPATRKLVIGVAGLAAAAGPLLVVLGTLLRSLKTIHEVAPKAGRAMKGTAGQFGAAAAGALAAAAAADALGSAFVNAVKGAPPAVDDLTFAMEGLAATGDVPESVAGSLDSMGEAIERLADPQLTDNWIGYLSSPHADNAKDKIAALDDALASLVAGGKAEAAAAGFEEMAKKAEEQGVSVDELKKMLPDYAKELDKAELAQAEAAGTADDATGATDRYTDSIEDGKEEIKRYTDAVQKHIDKQRAMVDPVFAAEKSLRDLEDAHQEAKDAAAEHGAESDEAKEAQLRLAEQAMATKGDLSLLKAAVEDGTVSVSDMEAAYRELEEQGFIPPGTTDRVIGQLQAVIDKADETGDVDPTVNVGTDLDPALRSLHGFDVYLGRVTRNRTVRIDTVGTQVSGGRIHTGGYIAPGGRLVTPRTYHTGGHVGMASPLSHDEVPAILQTGEYVLNRRQTAALQQLAGGVRFHDGGSVTAGVRDQAIGQQVRGEQVRGAGGFGGSIQVEVPLHLNGREIARATGNFGMDQLLTAITRR